MSVIFTGVIVAAVIAFCAVVCILHSNELAGIILLLCDVGFLCIFCLCVGLVFTGTIKNPI